MAGGFGGVQSKRVPKEKVLRSATQGFRLPPFISFSLESSSISLNRLSPNSVPESIATGVVQSRQRALACPQRPAPGPPCPCEQKGKLRPLQAGSATGSLEWPFLTRQAPNFHIDRALSYRLPCLISYCPALRNSRPIVNRHIAASVDSSGQTALVGQRGKSAVAFCRGDLV